MNLTERRSRRRRRLSRRGELQSRPIRVGEGEQELHSESNFRLSRLITLKYGKYGFGTDLRYEASIMCF